MSEPTIETTHLCPPEGGGGLMPCCGRTPFEVPRTDRMTQDQSLVDCGVECEHHEWTLANTPSVKVCRDCGACAEWRL